MEETEGGVAVADSLEGLAEEPALTVPPREAIAVELEPAPQAVPAEPANTGMSWVVAGFVLLFLIICVRYRKNSRYFSLILQDATEVRERHNAFDDTLREKAFVVLLNLLWCASAGFLLFSFICRPSAPLALGGESIGRMGICMGMAAAYTVFLTLAYSLVGSVFSDSGKASLWAKGFLSSQGLEAILLFPVAMLGMCVPSLLQAMVICGLIVFIIVKILFIYKSFCIFFTESASWVLFLYYLCSLEIVPVVMTYAAAFSLA